jgi:EAL domain-containing protein (putative c-di-GMP-specific phosphodiesterase class I)/CheY-like chemotaxis protein
MELGQQGDDRDVFAAARIVVVDDHAANVTLLERILHAAGVAQVHTVTDPQLAVATCLATDPDVVLLDLHMPGLDGFAVLAQLQAALPAGTWLPVVVLTADGTQEARDRALRAGAADFLTKPFDQTEVLLRLRNLLQARSLYTQVRQHSETLQADLERRRARDLAEAEDQRRRRDRIDDVLRDPTRGMRMVFQPIMELQSGHVVGAEALARFDGQPRRPPNEWFDEAADVGRGVALELAAVASAVAVLDVLPSAMFLSVNVSPATAVQDELLGLLGSAPGSRLVLELTEHARIDDYDTLVPAIDALRDRGIRIAIDDAGAGYSGLRHILRLRPDILKLDVALTRDIDTDPARRALATGMVSFANELDAVVIAEGIETDAELAVLRSLDVPWGQGYHLGRPGPVPLAPRDATRGVA